MNYAALLAALVVPIVVRKSLVWLLHTNRVATYSDEELSAFRGAQYPYCYKGLFIIGLLLVGIPISLAVWFGVEAFNTDLLSARMRPILAPDAVFFNPAPCIFILAMAFFFIIFFGGLAVSSSLYLLLPQRMLAYTAAREKRLPVVRPQDQSKIVWKIADVVYVISVVAGLVGIPLYSSVGRTSINHISAYPRHENVPLSQVQSVDVDCRVSTDRRSESVDVGIVANASGRRITILSLSEGRLPIPFTTTNEIAAMYEVFAKNNVAVHENADPACAEAAAAWWKPEAKSQYDAFFGRTSSSAPRSVGDG